MGDLTTAPGVLIVHNRYRAPGGEDAVVEDETGLLRSAGHRVILYSRQTGERESAARLAAQAALASGMIWSSKSGRDIRALVRRCRPSVAHFHNTFPLISPAAYYAAKAEALPVVQTLHNYRFLCAAATFFRDGHSCTECLGPPVPWPAVQHACYRSHAASGAVAAMITVHRALRTWERMVDVYIAPTRYVADTYAQAGFPAGRIAVKPNFVHPDPGLGSHAGRYALFVGRLNVEKGVHVLLAAWRRLAGRIPLKIVGDGPLMAAAARTVRDLPGIELLGWRSRREVAGLMGQAACLVVPSLWPETFCLVVAEGFATGLPAIVSGHGALAELVQPRQTGLYHRPGDAEDLAAQLEWAWTHARELDDMGRAARQEFETKYTAQRNYRALIDIYDAALARLRH